MSDLHSDGELPRERDEYFSDLPKGIFAPNAGDTTLSVGIIGAGIAGLSAAIGLSRSGHDVEVCECFRCLAGIPKRIKRA